MIARTIEKGFAEMTSALPTRKPHWSFWAIGAVGLLFNLMGCANFLSQMSPENVASMPEAFRAIVESRPAWGTGAFAVAVFGGALGASLLLLRKSTAFSVLVASTLGAVVSQLPLVSIPDFPMAALIGGLSQVVVGVFLAWYSKSAERKGWIG